MNLAQTILVILLGSGIIAFLLGIRTVKPNEKAAILYLGDYKRFAKKGFNWIIPGLNTMDKIGTAQNMINIQKQEIITKDNLNANAALVVFYKVNEDEESVKKALYKIQDIDTQIVTLAQTTARNVIGKMNFTEVNSERNELNKQIFEIIKKEAGEKYGIDIVKVELKEIDPPALVQEAMNKVIIAENTKIAATNFATSVETQADGERRASIKKAEGLKQAAILEAEGKAKAFEMINKSFVGNAQILRKLDVVENSLIKNTKVIIPANTPLLNILGNLAGTDGGK